MAQLPLFNKTDDQQFMLLSTKWKSLLDPLLANPILNGIPLSATLINGSTTIYHGLGRTPVGWIILNVNAPATIYNPNPFTATTFTLVSNIACNVYLWVF